MLCAALALSLIAVGCRFSMVEPQPLAGPAPRGVAVWPSLSAQFADHEGALLTGLDAAVRSRGYRAVSLAVGRQLLVDSELWVPHALPPRDLTAVGQVLGVDALLVFEVREFETTEGEFRHARWDFAWQLVSTRGGGVLWRSDHHGTWSRSDEQRVDAQRSLEAEPEIIPIGGTRAWNFRSVADLAANLHRLALDRLPRSGRGR